MTIRRRTLKGYLVLKHSGWYRGLEWKEMEYRNRKGKQIDFIVVSTKNTGPGTVLAVISFPNLGDS